MENVSTFELTDDDITSTQMSASEDHSDVLKAGGQNAQNQGNEQDTKQNYQRNVNY